MYMMESSGKYYTEIPLGFSEIFLAFIRNQALYEKMN